MGHKVVVAFQETNHDNHIYNVGDTYPAEGFKSDEERVSFLSGKHPTYAVAFLAEEDEKEKGEPQETEDKKEEQDAEEKPKPKSKKK